MNKKQKTCLLIGIAVIVVMGLFPPWVLEYERRHFTGNSKFEFRYTIEPGPYSWISDPPYAEEKSNPYSTGFTEGNAKFIDLYRLGLQYFMVAVVTAGLVITFRDEKTTKQ